MNSYFSDKDKKLIWKEGPSKSLLKTCVFEVTSRHNTSSTGISGDYIIMNARDWVIVIAKKGEKLLMVKQYRHGEGKLSVEFPGGVIDSDESPEDAAKRELEEETGCIAKKLTRLGCLNPNPALFSNHVFIFLAEDLVETGVQHLDRDEMINVIELTENQVIDGMGTAEFPHALMATAMMLYVKHQRKYVESRHAYT